MKSSSLLLALLAPPKRLSLLPKHSPRVCSLFATLLALLLLPLSTTLAVAPYPYEALFENSPRSKAINLVFLAEGYTQSSLSHFKADVQKCTDALFQEPVFKHHKNIFNTYLIYSPSNQDGSDHPSLNIYKDTIFETSYGFTGLERGISCSPQGAQKAIDTVAQTIPEYTIVIFLVNDSTYGGTGGGGFAWISNRDDSPATLKHELGHALGLLADEYSDSQITPSPTSALNVTQNTSLDQIPWKGWIQPNTPLPTPITTPTTSANALTPVGLYEGAQYATTGWYRPVRESVMRNLSYGFGAVNEELISLRIIRDLAPPKFTKVTPYYKKTSSSYVKFSITYSIDDLSIPADVPYSITWFVDNQPQPTFQNSTSATLWSNAVGNGSHSIYATVTTSSPYILPVNNPTLSTWTWTLNVQNQPPYITPVSTQRATSNTPISIPISTKNGATLSLINPPQGVSLQNDTLIAQFANPGTYNVTLKATNASGTDSTTVSIEVLPPISFTNFPTTLTTPLFSPFSHQFTSLNPAGSTVTYSSSTLPSGLSLNSTTGLLSGTPTTQTPSQITLTASSPTTQTSLSFTLTITPPPLTITLPSQTTLPLYKPFSLPILTNHTASFSSSTLPSGFSLNPVTGSLSGTPTSPGSFTLTISATDSYNQTTSASLTLFVPKTPQLLNPSPSLTASYKTPFSISFPSDQTVTYSSTTLPSGFSLNPVTGTLSGTPNTPGSFSFTLTLTNSNGSTSIPLTLTVTPPALLFSTPATTQFSTPAYSFFQTTLTTNYPATFSAINLPSGLSIHPTTGILSGIPTARGVFTPVISATDPYQQTTTLSLRIEIPEAPSFNPSNRSNSSNPSNSSNLFTLVAAYQTPYSLNLNQLLNPSQAGSYQASNLPNGITLHPTTGVLSGSPQQIGSFPLTISLSNLNGSSSITLTLSVTPPPLQFLNLPSTPLIAHSNIPFQITLSTSNPASFSSSDLPPGLTLDPQSGSISGSPTARGTFSFSIQALDLYQQSISSSLTIHVPEEPKLTLPETTLQTPARSRFEFQIPSTQPGRFSAQGLPAGLTLNPTTGLISGTPKKAGSYLATLSFSNENGNLTTYLPIEIPPPTPRISNPAGSYSGLIPLSPENPPSLAQISISRGNSFSFSTHFFQNPIRATGPLSSKLDYSGATSHPDYQLTFTLDNTLATPLIQGALTHLPSNLSLTFTLKADAKPSTVRSVDGSYTFQILPQNSLDTQNSLDSQGPLALGTTTILKSGITLHTILLPTPFTPTKLTQSTHLSQDSSFPFVIPTPATPLPSKPSQRLLASLNAPTTHPAQTLASGEILLDDPSNPSLILWHPVSSTLPFTTTITSFYLYPLTPSLLPNTSFFSTNVPDPLQHIPHGFSIPFNPNPTSPNRTRSSNPNPNDPVLLTLQNRTGTLSGHYYHHNRLNPCIGVLLPPPLYGAGFVYFDTPDPVTPTIPYMSPFLLKPSL